MALYRIYIDEVGNHDMTHADDANERFLSLTGVIVESTYMLGTLQPEMEAIKRKYFQRDPDEPVIFHRKELLNKQPPFHPLRNPIVEQEFNSLKIRPKSANVAGLQLADLVAHPSRREILLDHGLIVDHRNTFGDQVCAILRQSKYLRDSRTRRISGYGKKLLP